MLRWVVAGVSAGSACAVFAEEPEHTEDPPTIVALEVTVAPDAPIRMMDGERYETYLRTLLRGLAPKTPIVSEGPDERAATHWICARFGAGATPRVVAVTLEAQTVVGGVRRTVNELSSTVELPIGEPEAVERFLRSEATRAVASGILWHPLSVPTPSGRDPDRRVGTASSKLQVPSKLRPERVATEVRLSPHPATPTLRRPYRSLGIIAAGFGVSLLAGGAWQGVLASREEAAFDRAATQVAASEAKAASERHARYANILFASGATVALAGATTFVLDALGMIGRSRTEPSYPAVAIVPIPGGAVGAWSMSFP
jgi:hypothetical protein